MPKQLFTEQGFYYTEDASKLDYEAGLVLRPLFKIYADLGFSPRDIAHVFHTAITDIELDLILDSRTT